MKAIHPVVGILVTVLAGCALHWHWNPRVAAAQAPVRFAGPTSSQPLALSADDSLLIVANPDNDSVTLFDVKNGNTRLAEIRVGDEPNGVALSPDGARAYVANTVSGTVTVLRINRSTSSYDNVVATIPVGAEPYGLALTPSGRKLYVANARSNSVSVIDTASNQVVRTIEDVGYEPRGIAITNGGANDSQETVFVTQFLSLPVAGKVDGADDAKAGHVTVISAATDTVVGEVILNPMADTGFKAAGDALQRIAPPAAPAPDDFKFVTGAYPNQLNNIAIRGRFAFVPNTGASPNGPVRFNVNTQSLLSVIDIAARTDAGRTINMHRAVSAQTNSARRFITQPWAIAFKHRADEGYVVSAASNVVVKVKVDPATGAATVQNDSADPTRVLQIPTGKNPRGIVVNSADTAAYVMNYVSRDVTVVDLSGASERVAATLRSANLPEPGTREDMVHIGKELYNTSVGEFDAPAPGGQAITGRMSAGGWGSCSACHPFGLSDNVVWIFPTGPKRTIPQHVDFDQADPARATIRGLNWSAERDEEEDFELNIRAVSGGQGLIVQADGVTPDPDVANFAPLASGGRNQLKVRGVPAWDAIKAFVQEGIRAPISPVSKTDPDVVAGRQLFMQAKCQNCHGGPQWSSSRVRYTPPPDPSLVVNGQLIAELRPVGTFDPQAFNEVRANGAPPLGADGFTPAPLLSIFAFPQTFLHNGAATSLEAVLENAAHRSAGTPGTDYLQAAADRQKVVRFLLSIDADSEPIAPDAPGDLRVVSSGSYRESWPLAPDSAASAFGSGLATESLGAPSTDLPRALAGTTVSVKDAAGVLRLAPLFYVGPGQVNFSVPASAATGAAEITVASGSGATARASVEIAQLSPGIYAANGGGTGVAAALAVRVAAGGTQTPVAVFTCAAGGACNEAPIDLGASGESVYVTFYGTGLRNASPANVRCTIGGVEAAVTYAGAHPQYASLDQLNVLLPASLKGRGSMPVIFTIEGRETNPVTINVQ
jgi:uncharacterized protein (TIGR03437 family)